MLGVAYQKRYPMTPVEQTSITDVFSDLENINIPILSSIGSLGDKVYTNM